MKPKDKKKTQAEQELTTEDNLEGLLDGEVKL